ncbi:hypothetical protein Tco_0456609 [Tanacetum coccineum]
MKEKKLQLKKLIILIGVILLCFRYHALQNRPFFVAEVRKNMCMYLKNQGGYKMCHFKGISYEEIRPIFERVWDQIQSFVPMDFKKEKGSEKKSGGRRKKSLAKKRARETLSEESAKKQKLEDDTEKEEIQVYLNIVLEEESIDVESLATKYPIVDWETQILANDKYYYQIKRADGSVKHYKIFSAILYDFNRQDVLELYRLVKDRFQTASPEVHVLLMDTGLVIHMMVEKKYPMSQDTLSKMLSRRLEVDHQSEMGYELIRLLLQDPLLCHTCDDLYSEAEDVTSPSIVLDYVRGSSFTRLYTGESSEEDPFEEDPSEENESLSPQDLPTPPTPTIPTSIVKPGRLSSFCPFRLHPNGPLLMYTLRKMVRVPFTISLSIEAAITKEIVAPPRMRTCLLSLPPLPSPPSSPSSPSSASPSPPPAMLPPHKRRVHLAHLRLGKALRHLAYSQLLVSLFDTRDKSMRYRITWRSSYLSKLRPCNMRYMEDILFRLEDTETHLEASEAREIRLGARVKALEDRFRPPGERQ